MKWMIIIVAISLFSRYISAQSFSELEDDGTIISASLVDISSGKELINFHQQMRLTPASLLKIVTTATALESLGPKFTFKTKVLYNNIVADTLYGNIIVNAGGDPTLGSAYFSQTDPEQLLNTICQSIKDKGVHVIHGEIKVVIPENMHSYSAARLWEDMGNYYGASPGAFNWRDNTAFIHLQSFEVGDTCVIKDIFPKIEPYKIECKTVAASHKKDSAYVYGVSEMKKWWMDGSIPANRDDFVVKAALPDPKLAFINELKRYLEISGIHFITNKEIKDSLSQNSTKLLIEIESPLLSDIIKETNHKSINLFADQLLLTLGNEIKGRADWDLGTIAIQEFWQSKIDFKKNFRMVDGSGLSPVNLMSAKGMCNLLCWMKENSNNYSFFKESLAMGGVNGTLRSVFREPKIAGRIIGKSGSMQGVLGYCGYINAVNGKQLAFCVITNNYLNSTKAIRKYLDRIISQWVLFKD